MLLHQITVSPYMLPLANLLLGMLLSKSALYSQCRSWEVSSAVHLFITGMLLLPLFPSALGHSGSSQLYFLPQVYVLKLPGHSSVSVWG